MAEDTVGIPEIEGKEISQVVADKIASQIIDSEFTTAKTNRVDISDDFEAFIDLLEANRTQKEYDWMSDIRLPEFSSRHQTQLSQDVAQYFDQRDYVEVYIEEDSEEAVAAANANKELINRTLNQAHIHHYNKFVRMQSIKHLIGKVYIRCWWEQEVRDIEIDVPIVNEDEPGIKTTSFEKQTKQEIKVDRFNYDVIDPRNIFYDNTYTYSLQEKPWVTVRSEATIESLRARENQMGYINLDIVEERQGNSNQETETAKNSYNAGAGNETPNQVEDKPVTSKFDVLERFGKYYCKVEERDENEDPTIVSPGMNEQGMKIEDAELLDVIIAFAMVNGKPVLIRYQLNPFKDANGNIYKPLSRGLCYIHPTSDGGFGDGKAAEQIQIAIDDSFNVGMDRSMLAATPTLMVDKASLEDNSEVYIEPGHNIPLEDIEHLKELIIKDDIGGVLNQISMLSASMDKTMAVYPTTMGALPGQSSTTATAVVGSQQKSDIRSNFKSLTFEHTLLQEMYWMISQMTFSFAMPETAMKLMGEKAFDFDPSKDYWYKPISEAMDSEQTKGAKVQKWQQILSLLMPFIESRPDIIPMVNMIMVKIAKLFGDEYSEVAKVLLDPQAPTQGEGGEEGGAGGQPAPSIAGGPVASNQNGIEQSNEEIGVREGANGL